MTALRRLLPVCIAAYGIAALFALPAPAGARPPVNRNAVSWPATTITYAVGCNDQCGNRAGRAIFRRTRAAVADAADSWNRSQHAYQFRAIASEDDANVEILPPFADDTGPCFARGQYGFNFFFSFDNYEQSSINFDGTCSRYVFRLAAAHELGHVLALDHDRSGDCSIMFGGRFEGSGRKVRPGSCSAGPEYWRDPVQATDADAARGARARPVRYPFALCYRADGTPWSDTAARDPFCRRQYECPNFVGPVNGSDEHQQDNFCTAEPYDKAHADKRSAGRRWAGAPSAGWERFSGSRRRR